MKKILLTAFVLTALFSCQRDENSSKDQTNTQPADLKALTQDNPEWVHENLRLVPIVADAAFAADNAAIARLLTLDEAIREYHFRISEKVPFGRFEDNGAVNQLTAQNKLEQPVYLMSGDVVQGGRQDRVIGDDQVIAANRIKDVPVFCVEHGRWTYQESDEAVAASSEAQRKKIFAFSGYYHVAATDIRKTLNGSKSQSEVWDKVSKFRAAHSVEAGTEAYTALETAEAYTKNRDAYLDFFKGKFDQVENVVGVIAISGDKILAADVFGHPDLFRRQMPSLLHSYVADAITYGSSAKGAETVILKKMENINRGIGGDKTQGTRFDYEGKFVHFTSL